MGVKRCGDRLASPIQGMVSGHSVQGTRAVKLKDCGLAIPLMRVGYSMLNRTFECLNSGNFLPIPNSSDPTICSSAFSEQMIREQSKSLEGSAHGYRSDSPFGALQKRGHRESVKVTDRSACGTSSIQKIKNIIEANEALGVPRKLLKVFVRPS